MPKFWNAYASPAALYNPLEIARGVEVRSATGSLFGFTMDVMDWLQEQDYEACRTKIRQLRESRAFSPRFAQQLPRVPPQEDAPPPPGRPQKPVRGRLEQLLL